MVIDRRWWWQEAGSVGFERSSARHGVGHDTSVEAKRESGAGDLHEWRPTGADGGVEHEAAGRRGREGQRGSVGPAEGSISAAATQVSWADMIQRWYYMGVIWLMSLARKT